MSSNSSSMAESRALGGIAASRQPIIGLLFLVVVLIVGFVLSFSVGLVNALLVLGPLTTIWLPFLVVNAVWWRGWPFAGLPQPLAGIGNLVLQVILTAIGVFVAQSLVVGSFNTAEMFNPPFRMFPFLMPFAALVFGVMLHLTFILGLWPFRNLEYRLAGVVAVITSWIVGGILYIALCNWNPLPAQALGSMPNPSGLFFAMDTTTAAIWVIAWQMVLGVLLGGWPFKLIKDNSTALATSTIAVLALGIVTYFVLQATVGGPAVVALGATSIFGAFVWGMALETWPVQGQLTAGRALTLVILAFATSAIWYFVLNAIALATTAWPPDLPSQLYVGIASLNFFTAVIVLYYAIFHRWPFSPPGPPPA